MSTEPLAPRPPSRPSPTQPSITSPFDPPAIPRRDPVTLAEWAELGKPFVELDLPRPPIGWAIVELLGHRRELGFLSEQEIAGRKFLRLATPLWDEERQDWPPAIEGADPLHRIQFFSTAAVYAITPTTEDDVRGQIAPWVDCGVPVPVHVEGSDEPAPQPCLLRRGHDGEHDPDLLADLPF